MAETRDQMTQTSAQPAAAHYPPAGGKQYSTAGRSSEQIRRDIEHTRGEMSGTVEALERKISPQRIWNELVETVRDEGRRSTVLQSISSHPMPVVLMAAGAAWMAVDSVHERKTSGHGAQAAGAEHGRLEAEPAKRKASEVQSKLSGAADTAREKAAGAKEAVSDAGEKASSAASGAAHAAQRASSEVRHGASQAAHRLQTTGSHVADSATHAARRAKREVWSSFQEHPLAVGAAVAAAGVALGMLLPSSRREDELMGEARDDVLDTAKEAGMDLARRGEEVGQAALHAAEDEAEQQDLSKQGLAAGAAERAQELTDKAERVVESAKEAAEEEAEQQNLTPEDASARAREAADEAREQAKEDIQRKAEQRGPENSP
ncbi:MAG: DUF3618 domain-containing protein [Planctomycetota bacterium]